MINNRLEKIIHKVAKEKGYDENTLREVIDSMFFHASRAMNDYRYPEIRIPNLGIFRARPTIVEDEMAKLLYVLRNHKFPTHLKKHIDILVKTAKRLRHERKFRKRKGTDRVAIGTE